MLTTRKRNRYNFALPKFWVYADEPDGGADDGGEQGGAQESGVSADLDVGGQSPASEATVDWNSVIPEDLREKPYFQNILKAEDPGKELVNQFDNAQKLIGQKPTAVPKDDASDEDWNKFYEATRPEKAEDYELKPADLGEDKKHISEFLQSQGVDETFQGEVKALMHKHGLTKKQAGFVTELEGMFTNKIAGVVEEYATAESNLAKDFDKMIAEDFGGDKDNAIKAARGMIDKLGTERTKKYGKGLSNDALMVIADMGVQFNKKYESEDSITPSNVRSGGDTPDSIRAEMHKLMASDAYTNPMHVENDKTLAAVRELSGRLVKAEKALRDS